MSETQEIKDRAVELVAQYSIDRKAEVNPFSRSGITARRLADQLGFFKAPGKTDTQRSKRLLKEMIVAGKERTLQAGSAYTEIYHLAP